LTQNVLPPNYCAKHAQYYTAQCVYCGVPQTERMFMFHFCVSDGGTVPRCVLCGATMFQVVATSGT